MRFILKENKPLKVLARDTLVVYLSVILGNFVMSQVGGIDISKSVPRVFTNTQIFNCIIILNCNNIYNMEFTFMQTCKILYDKDYLDNMKKTDELKRHPIIKFDSLYDYFDKVNTFQLNIKQHIQS